MSVSHTCQGLYPIIRRVRRPLLPVEPEAPAQAVVAPDPIASDKRETEKEKEKETPEQNDA